MLFYLVCNFIVCNCKRSISRGVIKYSIRKKMQFAFAGEAGHLSGEPHYGTTLRNIFHIILFMISSIQWK